MRTDRFQKKNINNQVLSTNSLDGAKKRSEKWVPDFKYSCMRK